MNSAFFMQRTPVRRSCATPNRRPKRFRYGRADRGRSHPAWVLARNCPRAACRNRAS